MKTKKLKLNKVTISKLENQELENLYGGIKVIPKTNGAITCNCPYIPPTDINKQ
jgi:natural product precursor